MRDTVSQNLNEIDDDDANKKVQHNWCPGNQTKCRGETVAVSGCDQIFMEGKAESALPITDPPTRTHLIYSIPLPPNRGYKQGGRNAVACQQIQKLLLEQVQKAPALI